MTNTSSSNSIKVAIVAVIHCHDWTSIKKVAKVYCKHKVNLNLYVLFIHQNNSRYIQHKKIIFLSDFHVQSVNALFRSFFSLTRTRSILSLSLASAQRLSLFLLAHTKKPGDFIELFQITSATI